MKTFRTYSLALQLYKKYQQRRNENRFDLPHPIKGQFDRAILSIPLNLIEGSSRPTVKDRRKFYYIALGSLREIQSLLEIISDEELKRDSDILGAHLYLLCKKTI